MSDDASRLRLISIPPMEIGESFFTPHLSAYRFRFRNTLYILIFALVLRDSQLLQLKGRSAMPLLLLFPLIINNSYGLGCFGFSRISQRCDL